MIFSSLFLRSVFGLFLSRPIREYIQDVARHLGWNLAPAQIDPLVTFSKASAPLRVFRTDSTTLHASMRGLLCSVALQRSEDFRLANENVNVQSGLRIAKELLNFVDLFIRKITNFLVDAEVAKARPR